MDMALDTARGSLCNSGRSGVAGGRVESARREHEGLLQAV